MLIYNPLLAYRQWRDRRLQAAKNKDFARGFEYAATQLLSGRAPEEIASYVDHMNPFSQGASTHSFDRGISKAIGEWQLQTAPAPRGQRRVVCSAVRYPNGNVLVGARHFGPAMRDQYKALGITAEERESVQGFLDQWDVFMTRQEALVVATEARQIICKTHPQNRLFSEDIY